jgi:hypothetical protein
LQTLGLVPVAITVAACAGIETKIGAITAITTEITADLPLKAMA